MLFQVTNTDNQQILINPWQVECIYQYHGFNGKPSTKIQMSKGSYIHTYASVEEVQEEITRASI